MQTQPTLDTVAAPSAEPEATTRGGRTHTSKTGKEHGGSDFAQALKQQGLKQAHDAEHRGEKKPASEVPASEAAAALGGAVNAHTPPRQVAPKPKADASSPQFLTMSARHTPVGFGGVDKAAHGRPAKAAVPSPAPDARRGDQVAFSQSGVAAGTTQPSLHASASIAQNSPYNAPQAAAPANASPARLQGLAHVPADGPLGTSILPAPNAAHTVGVASLPGQGKAIAGVESVHQGVKSPAENMARGGVKVAVEAMSGTLAGIANVPRKGAQLSAAVPESSGKIRHIPQQSGTIEPPVPGAKADSQPGQMMRGSPGASAPRGAQLSARVPKSSLNPEGRSSPVWQGDPSTSAPQVDSRTRVVTPAHTPARALTPAAPIDHAASKPSTPALRAAPAQALPKPENVAAPAWDGAAPAAASAAAPSPAQTAAISSPLHRVAMSAALTPGGKRDTDAIMPASPTSPAAKTERPKPGAKPGIPQTAAKNTVGSGAGKKPDAASLDGLDKPDPSDLSAPTPFDSVTGAPKSSPMHHMKPLTPPILARHVAQQLAAAAAQLPDRPVELALNPEELGRVRMTLSVSDSALTVNIVADRTDTIDLMRRHIETLAQDFKGLGYGSVDFQFSHNSQHNNAQTGFSQQAEPNHPSAPPLSGIPTDSPPQAPARVALQASDRLDLRL